MRIVELEKKILLVGEAGVGKTSLIRRYVIDKFDDKYIVTIGTKVSRKVMEFAYPAEGVTVSLMMGIWDVIGQMSSERAHELHFRGAESFILVLDGTRRPTYDALEGWAQRVRKHCGEVPGVLACNKADLRGQFQVKEAEVAEAARALGLAPFFTSAKTGENVDAMFRKVGEALCAPVVEKYKGGGRGAR